MKFLPFITVLANIKAPSFPWFWGTSLFSSSARNSLSFLSVFRFFSSDFRGSVGINNYFYWTFSLPCSTKKTKPAKDRKDRSILVCLSMACFWQFTHTHTTQCNGSPNWHKHCRKNKWVCALRRQLRIELWPPPPTPDFLTQRIRPYQKYYDVLIHYCCSRNDYRINSFWARNLYL